jgi:hypothetical protein
MSYSSLLFFIFLFLISYTWLQTLDIKSHAYHSSSYVNSETTLGSLTAQSTGDMLASLILQLKGGPRPTFPQLNLVMHESKDAVSKVISIYWICFGVHRSPTNLCYICFVDFDAQELLSSGNRQPVSHIALRFGSRHFVTRKWIPGQASRTKRQSCASSAMSNLRQLPRHVYTPELYHHTTYAAGRWRLCDWRPSPVI